MTTGVYLLRFPGTSKVYVGQSKHIQYRYTEHLRTLRKGVAAKKLQQAYIEFGEPELEVLCECTERELDSLENEAIEIFSSYENGFNTFRKESGSLRSQSGLSHSNSKYSKFQILKVFSLLYRCPHFSYREVAAKARTNVYLVHNIASCRHHLWLAAEYPEQFVILRSYKNNKKALTQKTIETVSGAYKLVNHEGKTVLVTNIRKFCMEEPSLCDNVDSARSAIGKVIKGSKLSHKGWKLFKEEV